jgi:hypothetical protein
MNFITNIVKEEGITKIIEKQIKYMSYGDIINKYNEDWEQISHDPSLNLEFIDFCKDKVVWGTICWKHKLSESLIRKYQHYFNYYAWNMASIHSKLSEDFIREFQDKVEWNVISIHQTLSEDFIREFQDKVCWRWISGHQKLSDDFLQEFSHNINWSVFSQYQQNLSENFLRTHRTQLNFYDISKNNHISEQFILDFPEYHTNYDWYYIAMDNKHNSNFLRQFKMFIFNGFSAYMTNIPQAFADSIIFESEETYQQYSNVNHHELINIKHKEWLNYKNNYIKKSVDNFMGLNSFL